MTAPAQPLEFSEPGDRFYDYCLWEYPAAAPADGKLRSVNLLSQSFDSEGLGAQAHALVAALRADLGISRTVWGIKHENGRISWEFYFYDYARRQRTCSVARVLEVMRPWIASGLAVSESVDYFMFSIDIDAGLLSQRAPLRELQVYIGNVGSTVSSGISYQLTQEALQMKNFYFFFNARTEVRQIVDKVRSSVFLDLDRFNIDSVLWPELRECQTIVVANKRGHDGVYFSRITIDQLILFMNRMQFPQAQIAFATAHRGQLDHLLWDVGIDYRMEGGALKILKSAYYGVF
ncbi:MAG: hypothetical protein EOO28_29005 [Comamonadaceae bacterium]|nr:MAG: hypothetical protein EOO28_29005 [Comamonadaceae bacterium]